jgi:hypothetical protein
MLPSSALFPVEYLPLKINLSVMSIKDYTKKFNKDTASTSEFAELLAKN